MIFKIISILVFSVRNMLHLLSQISRVDNKPNTSEVDENKYLRVNRKPPKYARAGYYVATINQLNPYKSYIKIDFLRTLEKFKKIKWMKSLFEVLLINCFNVDFQCARITKIIDA